ncbi:hypothetical protein GCM10009647_071890 [Streptomyces sanglieri]
MLFGAAFTAEGGPVKPCEGRIVMENGAAGECPVAVAIPAFPMPRCPVQDRLREAFSASVPLPAGADAAGDRFETLPASGLRLQDLRGEAAKSHN